MELRLSSLVAYLISSAYLMGWFMGQALSLYLSGRSWLFQHQMAGRMLSLKSFSRSGNRIGILISLAGALSGCLITSWFSQWMIKEWLLVSLVILSILSEEFKASNRKTQLLAVIVLLDRIQAHFKPNEDLFDILAKVVQELPTGEVQEIVREAILRRRSGIAAEKSMDALRRIDPFLGEFVLNLQLIGWQNGPVLNLILSRLLQRAGRKWDHTSRIMLIKDYARPYIQFGRAALIVGLSYLLFGSPTGLIAAWPGHTLVVLMVLALLASGFLLFLSLSIKWLRRSLAVLIFLIVLAPYANSIPVQMPYWIQVQTITHNPASLSDFGNGSVSPMVVDHTQTVLSQSTLSIRLLPGSQNGTFVAVSTPTFSLTPTSTIPVSTHTYSIDMEFIDPCCHRFQQPR
jgi:hypothetical protein